MPSHTAQTGQIVEAPPEPSGEEPRPGGIVLCRHGEPALSRKVKLTASQYRDWWALYEAGGILAGQAPPEHLKQAAAKAGVILTSTRLRSIETARALIGGRELAHDEVFIEAPLPPPPWPDILRFSPKTWGVISRISWWLGGHGGQETRPQAQKRAAAAALQLHELANKGDNVLVVAHGFFNTMIGVELRKLGWRVVRGRGWRYWSTRYYERSEGPGP
jgi:broad specificity phosphatase PhoE